MVKSRPLDGACSSTAERFPVDKVLIHGVYGVAAAQHTVDVLARVRAPLDTPKK
jgi:hypothetical protein